MTLRYTPEARQDLREMHQYVSESLGNPTAANKLVENLLRSCANLKVLPLMGLELAAKTGRDTDLRVLVCGSHLAFYRVEETCISIIRILNGRTDYLSSIFDENQ
jgi:plasmid stabilization system protein ParE